MALREAKDNKTTEEIKGHLSGIKCWLLDMDGTVSLGENLIPGADRFFSSIKGKEYIFLTNNSSHGLSHYIDRLNRLGIEADRENILISTDALVMYLNKKFGRKIKAFTVGTPDFEQELESSGIILVREITEDVDAVLVGFDTTLTYRKLDIACALIRSGVPWFAANPDRVCPLEGGRVLPDCGAIIAFLETCTEIKPDKVIGKPETAMADMIMEKYGYAPEEMAMVGDRIYTDLAFARKAGIMCIAVLTGESTLEQIQESETDPDYIFDNIGDIADFVESQ